MIILAVGLVSFLFFVCSMGFICLLSLWTITWIKLMRKKWDIFLSSKYGGVVFSTYLIQSHSWCLDPVAITYNPKGRTLWGFWQWQSNKNLMSQICLQKKEKRELFESIYLRSRDNLGLVMIWLMWYLKTGIWWYIYRVYVGTH